MDNSQNNCAGTPPAEEQVQRQVEETVVASNSGSPSGAGVAPKVVHIETAQNNAQGEGNV
jgi:hypothetical protein